MANEYEVTGKNLSNQQYRKAVVESSPILENAVYLLSGGNSIAPRVGYASSHSSSCNSSSCPCNAVSLESKLK